MNQLDTKKRVQVIACLVEGNSIRSTVRMTGVAKNTVTKLLVDIGKVCAEYQDANVRHLTCKRIRCDEIWAFVYSKQKNVPEDKKGEFGYGDVYTWTGLDADTKLMVSWLVGKRDAAYGEVFMHDLADRLTHKVQLTTDGHKAYLEAVESAFGGSIDYAMLIKLFGTPTEGDVRYSPSVCTGTRTQVIVGQPDAKYIGTSYVERQNLTMRMGMRRFTRLTNAFSKKVENLEHAVALHFMYYNFVRVHQTLKTTPAVAAGIADYVWSIAEIVSLLEK
ncbi:IS1 family transposase [Thermosynechococcaceae cyanobacterium BACA0444]|uniref:IS1 family transposase n=1 Tax=Pseudocalidococcus azoricus BACA0444 TaxID=2918990 RepID=A0AAE4JWF7_9CYAN|nr:IS1 family transposase [Pseudocalidococcus azoricus]MDS3860098.1 IS1 family transposase [Pseudocalidococcus azoricus BACA0444]